MKWCGPGAFHPTPTPNRTCKVSKHPAFPMVLMTLHRSRSPCRCEGVCRSLVQTQRNPRSLPAASGSPCAAGHLGDRLPFVTAQDVLEIRDVSCGCSVDLKWLLVGRQKPFGELAQIESKSSSGSQGWKRPTGSNRSSWLSKGLRKSSGRVTRSSWRWFGGRWKRRRRRWGRGLG